MTHRAPATVIYTHGGGQLGNQVLRLAHWLAWAIEHAGAVEVRDLAFWPHAEHFAAWRNHAGCLFPPRADAWAEVARALRLLPPWVRHRADWRVQRAVQALAGDRRILLNDQGGETLDLGDSAGSRALLAAGTTTCAGWRVGSWELLARHQAVVRPWLQPARDPAARAADFIGALRTRHDVLLGLHLRQGDYRSWHDGRFLFSPAQYRDWAGQALALHAGRRPAIVLATDDPAAAAELEGLPVFRPPGGAVIDDWTALAHCDVILGPPSTFSATAAFVGERPLWPLVRAGQQLDPAQVLADGLFGAARHPEFSLAVR